MATKKQTTIAEELDQLFELQTIHSTLDKIQILKGELPMEVADLEDDIVGLETRLVKINSDVEEKEADVLARKNGIKESEGLILRYRSQLDNVKNNREYDALSKEIELQELEMQLHEKKIKELQTVIVSSKEIQTETKARLDAHKKDLEHKRKELDKIIKETEKEEATLNKKAEKVEEQIEDRLIIAYRRIRGNYKNGLAVVEVERESCGGCFGKVPPQMQMDIRQRKKILLCEHCGRIMVAAKGEE
jgi:predicted  nucleic acid-binding Zn-ribbon protein